jgi:hypothetical protein
MRLRLLLLCLPLLLAACSKSARPVQLDFVGISTLTSGNNTVQPNDTLTTRAYAVGNDNTLKRLTIKVTYEPALTPIIYPSPLASYDPKNLPDKNKQQEIIYLDSLIVPQPGNTNGHAISEALFVNQFTARSTSGTELWQYTATDVTGASASRAYRLTARKTDSAAVFHSFTTILRPVPRRAVVAPGVRSRSRVFLNLQYGLLLPKYAVLNQERSVEANQNLVDLICVANGTTVRLVAPANTVDSICTLPAVWATRRATGLRLTGLTAAQFGTAVDADLPTSYNNSGDLTPNVFATAPLSAGQVLAFKITEGSIDRYGLLLVSSLVLGSSPVLVCSVKVQK